MQQLELVEISTVNNVLIVSYHFKQYNMSRIQGYQKNNRVILTVLNSQDTGPSAVSVESSSRNEQNTEDVKYKVIDGLGFTS